MDNKQRFGQLREAYAESRRGYPEECIRYISALIGEDTRVLDLGCGTGIATRQLAEVGFNVVGIDSDKDMLVKAREHKTPMITYILGPADNISFSNGEFGAVTAFGAFHWFCDKKSVAEIKRVLEEEGVFVVINKNDNDRFRRVYRAVLTDFAQLPPSVKRGYSPLRILERNGFYDVARKVFSVVETFSIDEAITHVKSRETWNYIPQNSYVEATRRLREEFGRRARNGEVRRSMEVVMVYGRKRLG